MATLAEQLASVQAAIEAVEGHGQSIAEDGGTWSHADLNALYRREQRLLARIERQSTGRVKVAEL